jgi:hypothetical protein
MANARMFQLQVAEVQRVSLQMKPLGAVICYALLIFGLYYFYTERAQIRKGGDVARVRHLWYFRIDELCSVEKMEYANYGGGYFMGWNSLGSDYISNLSIQCINIVQKIKNRIIIYMWWWWCIGACLCTKPKEPIRPLILRESSYIHSQIPISPPLSQKHGI